MAVDLHQDRSRRQILRLSVGGALGGVALTACSTLGLPKVSKADANYVDRYRGPEQCEHCLHFVAPHGCTVVAGDISPHGHSKFYLPKA
jgi:hypothetical protein